MYVIQGFRGRFFVSTTEGRRRVDRVQSPDFVVLLSVHDQIRKEKVKNPVPPEEGLQPPGARGLLWLC